MGKCVLVMDMPSSCRECPLELQKFQCAFNSEIMKDNTVRQDWCPLRELPEKKVLSGDVADIQKMGKELIDIGYNACIDEISKGGE